jgi:hypothetical protein
MRVQRGEKWTAACGMTIEWLCDLGRGDALRPACLLVNGQHPKAQDTVPWLHFMESAVGGSGWRLRSDVLVSVPSEP